MGRGVAARLPRLRFMPVENGSGWARPLVTTLQKVYERTPEIFDEDPMVTMKRSIFVHPFHEEDVLGLVELVGADNVVFASDYPHPEPMFYPPTLTYHMQTPPTTP